MPSQPVLINVGTGTAQPVWMRQAGSTVTFINTDPSNTVYLGYTNTITPNGSNTIPLQPGASITLDGIVTIYAIAPQNTLPLSIVPGSATYSPGSILISGTPTIDVNGNVQVVGNGGTFPQGNIANLFMLTTSQNLGSFQTPIISVSNYTALDVGVFSHCANQGTNGAPLTTLVIIRWFENSTGSNFIYEEDWNIYCANAAPLTANNYALGSIPVRGQFFQILVINQGAVNSTLDVLFVTGTYRNVPLSSVRQNVPPITINGVSVQSAGPNDFSNRLAILPNFTPNIGLKVYPMPLFAGEVWHSFFINTAALLNSGTLVDLASTESGTIVAGSAGPGVLFTETNAINSSAVQEMFFPRSPVALVINPAATSAVQFSIIADQRY